MHTYEGEKTRFHFDSGLTGNMLIVDKDTGKEIKTIASDLLELIAYEYILPKEINKLEDMDYKDLLGLNLDKNKKTNLKEPGELNEEKQQKILKLIKEKIEDIKYMIKIIKSNIETSPPHDKKYHKGRRDTYESILIIIKSLKSNIKKEMNK